MTNIRENLVTGRRRYLIAGVRVPRAVFNAFVGGYCWAHNTI